MPRRAATVTQADIARMIRAATQNGLKVVRVVTRPDSVAIETSGEAVVEPTAGSKRVIVL